MIYYSGSNQAEVEQKDKTKSLGGFKSSTKIPNGQIGNLFGSISNKTLQDKSREIKVFFFKNETGSVINDLTVYIEEETEVANWSIGAQNPNESGAVEKIPNKDSKPYTVQLQPLSTTPILITNTLENDGSIGFFLERSIDPNYQNRTCEELNELFEAGVEKIESFEEICELSFGWT